MARPEILWSILCPTLSSRQAKFLDLMSVLLPQAERHLGRVEVAALQNDGERPLGEYRQALLEDARGEYVSFVDDDDTVAPDFILTVTLLLALRPDVAAFTVEYSEPGRSVPSYNSLVHEPHDTADALYRDLTHVQPVRADLALRGDFRAGWPEDNAWRNKVRPLLETEASTNRVLYFYRHDPGDSVQCGLRPHAHAPRPVVDSPAFRWHPWSTG